MLLLRPLVALLAPCFLVGNMTDTEFPQQITGRYGTVQIAVGQPADLDAVLALFDAALAWLVERGITAQWGTTPFSAKAEQRGHFLSWLQSGTFFVARLGAELVGTLALSPTAPAYVASLLPAIDPAGFYLEAFTTARRLQGQGLGHDLLRWAEVYSRVLGKTTLWLDCFAGEPALPRYYRSAGFIPYGDFTVGQWPGQVLWKPLKPPADAPAPAYGAAV
jgi:GNAT superfamily N-acetyltransferase